MRFIRENRLTNTKSAAPSGHIKIRFMKKSDPVAADNTVTAFKRFSNRETLTKHRRIRNDAKILNMTKRKSKTAVWMNPYSLFTRKTLKKGKRSGKKSGSKIITTEHKKKVENYDFMNNTVQAQADIAFGSIASRNIDFA